VLFVAVGVVVDNGAGNVAHILQQLFVAREAGNLQVEGNAALLCTLNVAGAAAGEALDWVLVIDDAGKGYTKPGKLLNPNHIIKNRDL